MKRRTSKPPPGLRSRLPRRLGPAPGTAALLVAGLTASTPASGQALAAPRPTAAADEAPSITPVSFASPPASVRPKYRWWLPGAYVDDAELRTEVGQMADAGAGGIEVVGFEIPGPKDPAFLAQYGWGTPTWAHKMQVIAEAARDRGLTVDWNLGPHYPPTVPTLTNFNRPEVAQQIIYGREFNAAGSTRTGALPATVTAPPTLTTTLCSAVAAGATRVGVTSSNGIAAGDVLTIGPVGTGETATVSSVGAASACTEVTVNAPIGSHAAG